MGLTPSQMTIATKPLYDIAMRNVSSNTSSGDEDDESQEIPEHILKILKKRLKNGEITKKEYDEIIKEIQES